MNVISVGSVILVISGNIVHVDVSDNAYSFNFEASFRTTQRVSDLLGYVERTEGLKEGVLSEKVSNFFNTHIQANTAEEGDEFCKVQ